MCSTAAAHLGHIVLGAERYIKVDVAAGEARVVVSLTLGPREGLRVLSAADHDRNGTVVQAEAERYLAEWGRGLETEMPIAVDGRRASVQWTEAYLDPVGPVREAPLTVEMVAHVPLAHGRHELVVSDRMRNEAIDRTDVAFRARDGAEIVASGLCPAPRRVRRDLAFVGTRRSDLSAVIRVPGAANAPGGTGDTRARSVVWIALPAAAIGVATIALVVVLARKRRRARPRG